MQLRLQSLREEVYSPSLPVLLDYGLDDRVLVHRDSFKINPTYNTDGLINWLCQPGLLRNQPQKSMRESLNPHFALLPPGLILLNGTESIGLAADARGVMVFANAIVTVSS